MRVDLIERARVILRANDRGGYTVPTDRLYPFQWNWDSSFVAMGWATFDEPRAFTEIAHLMRGQWDDGLVPQIVFHAPSDDYFPGPDVWGVQHDPPTSGITQPPILATAVRRLLDGARERVAAEARVASLYPGLRAWHRWWEHARDPARLVQWIAALSAAMAVTTLVLLGAPHLTRVLGERGMVAAERLMGLVLTALAVQMLLNGMRAFVAQLH